MMKERLDGTRVFCYRKHYDDTDIEYVDVYYDIVLEEKRLKVVISKVVIVDENFCIEEIRDKITCEYKMDESRLEYVIIEINDISIYEDDVFIKVILK